MSLSGYMVVLNESRCIAAAIESMRRYVDELLIMDCGSTDGTQGILADYVKSDPKITIEIQPQNSDRYSNEWDEPRRRNWCIEQCRYDWVLTMDGDETLDGIPSDYFRSCAKPLNMPRINVADWTSFIAKRNADDWYPDLQVRCFPKSFRYCNTSLHSIPIGPDGVRACDVADISEYHIWHWNAMVRQERFQMLKEHPEIFEVKPLFLPLPQLVPSNPLC